MVHLFKIMDAAGIIVGCNQNQEWLLDWWWHHYSKTNTYPVIFADFGLSEAGQKWCSERGDCITCPDLFPHSAQEQLPSATKQLWEQLYGKGVWNFRPVWLKKAEACFLSPFLKTIWIDLDCRVEADLTPLFNLLAFNIELAILKNSPLHQKMRHDLGVLVEGEYHYTSSVIAYHKHSAAISKWAELTRHDFDKFPADEEALSRAIYLTSPVIFELPEIYNQSWKYPTNNNTVITHFHGDGKLHLIRNFLTPGQESQIM